MLHSQAAFQSQFSGRCLLVTATQSLSCTSQECRQSPRQGCQRGKDLTLQESILHPTLPPGKMNLDQELGQQEGPKARVAVAAFTSFSQYSFSMCETSNVVRLRKGFPTAVPISGTLTALTPTIVGVRRPQISICIAKSKE